MLEGLRLRVKDVDLARRELIVRDGKGGKDRVTMLAAQLVEPLRLQIAGRKLLHEEDLAKGRGEVWLPDALSVKYPAAPLAFGWQYVFGAAGYSVDPRSGAVRRHHVDEKRIQRAVKRAAEQARIELKVRGSHSPSFALSLAKGLLARKTVVRQAHHEREVARSFDCPRVGPGCEPMNTGIFIYGTLEVNIHALLRRMPL